MAPLDNSLETLKIFLTSLGKYRTSVNLTVYPPCRLIFTVTYRSQFIFFPFTTVTSILRPSILSCFSLFMWYAMMHCCLPDILWGVLPCHSLGIFHRIRPLKLLSTSYSFSFFLYQQSAALWTFPHSCYILWWIKVFCYFLFLFPLFSFPQKSSSLSPYLPHLLHVILKNSLLCFFFSPYFSDRNFSLWSCLLVYCLLFPYNYVLQNQRIYFLGSLYAIFEMLTL